jgi:hypothetical protein
MNFFLRFALGCLTFVILSAAVSAWAHHGTATVSAIGSEGPGAAIDTTSALPLGQKTLFFLLKSEYADFQQRDGFSEQKRYSTFNTLAIGYGIFPWLSAFVFQPFNIKSQQGVGTNSGLGDTNLMVSLALKWDRGLKLVPEKESLDDLEDWHFGLWTACSLPVGSTEHRDNQEQLYAPDMQTGFKGPSPAVGLSLLKQLSADFTVLGEANFQAFFEQRYAKAGYHYRFGAETRVNAALVYRLWASSRSRIDLAPELSMLNLQRDTEDGVALQASGGTMLYGQLGVRATFGSFSLAASVKRAIVKGLNEEDEQQGSEGLENIRAALVLGYALRF